MKPSSPLWIGMKTRGFPDIFTELRAVSSMMGRSFSQALITISGLRYMSIMRPLVPLKKSPSVSKGAWVKAPVCIGKPSSLAFCAKRRE